MPKKHIAIILSAAVLLLAACNLSGLRPTAAAIPTATSIPPTAEPTALPSATPVTDTVVLTAQETEQHDDEYLIDFFLYQPVMEQPQAKAAAFNQAVQNLVQTEMNIFTTMIEENLEDQAQLAEDFGHNSFYLEYLPTYTEDSLVSLHFTISTYVMGAAHPFSYSKTLNYDLTCESVLTLDELFLPGSDYLVALSEQSIQIISENGYIDWPEGAAPVAENFRSWNITPEGLLISFDPYQIAPYAAGTQQALVPYAALENIIDPHRPLGKWMP